MEDRTIPVNRRARYDYEVTESVEAGLVLTGTEIKAIREGRVSLSDSYGKPENGEMWLGNLHIAQYSAGSGENHDPTRRRQLPLLKAQRRRLTNMVSERGLTPVPPVSNTASTSSRATHSRSSAVICRGSSGMIFRSATSCPAPLSNSITV